MKKEIHPKTSMVTITCACGNSFQSESTAGKDLSTEVCIKCHPYTTGKNKKSDAGRIAKFNEKYKIEEK